MAWATTLVATIKQFSDQFRSRVSSQSIKDISRVLQKLLKYFNGIIVSIFFVPLLPVWPVIFPSRLKESVVALASVKSVIAQSSFTVDTSLHYCHKIRDVFE